jgi:outer membrane protein assembly factor BamB/TolA-binding protein
MRRLLPIVVLPLFAVLAPVASPQAPPKEDRKAPELHSAITLFKNQEAQRLIGAAEDLIAQANRSTDEETRAEMLSKAAAALLTLLEVEEDAFVELRHSDPEGKETLRTVGIRAEAHRLLATLPPDGQQFYELLAGQKAKLLLTRARLAADVQLLRDVIQRYPQTQAAGEALNLLGTYHLERHRYHMAAPCFERLLQRHGAANLPTRTLFKAALAFFRAGDRAQGEATWNQFLLRAQRDGGLQLGDQFIDLPRLRQLLERKPGTEERSGADWGLFRGNLARNAVGGGLLTNLEPRWSVSTLPAPGAWRSFVEDVLRPISTEAHQRQQPILPAAFPVVVQRKVKGEEDQYVERSIVVFRTADGVNAVDLHTGTELWCSDPKEGLFKDPFREIQYRAELEKWKQSYVSLNQHGVVFENGVQSSLSTDASHVFVIEDLPVPLSPPSAPQLAWIGLGRQPLGPLANDLERNVLKAFNLTTGLLRWELKQIIDPRAKPEEIKAPTTSFFSGPPLALDGKLYLLHEQDSELRLVCLECHPADARGPERAEVVWVQPLANLKERLLFDVNRRIQASHLAYADGVLVCPTNAGAVLGIDLLSRSLVWAHNYREGAVVEEPKPPVVGGRVIRRPGMQLTVNVNPRWKASAPIIQDGKVVFSAPDGESIFCLNLRDGRLVWKDKRSPDDMYLAGVFGGKAVVVGKNHCRAIDLLSGKGLWRVENTGLPSGQGVMGAQHYYLPLRAGAESREPEICALDLARGAIVGRIKTPKDNPPGNLVFCQGMLLSQGLTGVTAYAQGDATASEGGR